MTPLLARRLLVVTGKGGAGKTTVATAIGLLAAGPATGERLGMLESPMTCGSSPRVGPVAAHTERVRALLADPARTGYLAVAAPSQTAVTDVLEAQRGLHERLGRGLDAVVVNGL